jgi:hypothetical protein
MLPPPELAQHNPEVDLVGADRSPVADRIDFAGSIKWIGSPFDRHDLETLRQPHPGYEPGRSVLAIVSLSGADLVWAPEEITGVRRLYAPGSAEVEEDRKPLDDLAAAIAKYEYWHPSHSSHR